MIRATIYTAAAAGFLAIAAPGAAQAAMPVNAGINTEGSEGMVQTVRWHHGHHWRRWHRRRKPRPDYQRQPQCRTRVTTLWPWRQ